MLSHAETILAPITGASPGAIAVIRLSGPEAWKIASKVFRSWPATPTPRLALYGTFTTGDDGLALPFQQGHSYTGEESVEFSIHGSTVSVQSLIEACLKEDCRLATPGEFTLRAFMNGKLQLDQAEGVRQAIESRTDKQFAQALRLKSGELGKEISLIRSSVTKVLAMVEASTDFSDEIGEVDHEAAKGILNDALAQFDKLLTTRNATRLLHEGATVVLVGRPNVGKSSLMNALLQQDRSIVTPIPGTTRDTVEASIALDGIPIRLIDTAGLRETEDEIERLGVDRSTAALRQADLALFIYDLSQGWLDEDEQLHSGLNSESLIVGNKSDLAKYSESLGIAVSAVTLAGVKDLLGELKSVLTAGDSEPSYLLDRHYVLLESAKEAIEETIRVFSGEIPDDLAAVTLRQALRTLGEITGETTHPDIIAQIFSDFCLGK